MPFGASMRGITSQAGTTTPAYKISQSCRFNDDDSAYLSRTPAGSGSDLKKATISFWFKRGNLSLGNIERFISAGSGASADSIFILTTTDNFVFNVAGVNLRKTTRVFRDPTAWIHAVVVFDSTQATASNRVNIYINGVQETAFATSNDPALNATLPGLNTATLHTISREAEGVGEFFDGYLADFVSIDGQALKPTSFGEFDSNGVWRPIDVSGLTFGTNGFHLDFANSADLGNDVSGNNNDFTSSGLTSADKMNDSPTDDAANNVGNYCTWSPLQDPNGLGAFTFKNGNLEVSQAASAGTMVPGTLAVSSGKFYWEITVGDANAHAGIISADDWGDMREADPDTSGYDTVTATAVYALTFSTGNKNNKTTSAAYGVTLTTNDIFQVALDLDNGLLFFGKNNTWMNSATAAEIAAGTSTHAAFTGISGTFAPFLGFQNSSITHIANFGQSSFTYTPPTGFKRLCTANLSAPTITDPSAYFQTLVFTGGGSSRIIRPKDGSGTAMAPDLVWIKDRDTIVEHVLVDSVRGATKELNSDADNNETTVAEGVKSFDASGFTLGTDSNYNASASPNVAWVWKESATAGFDIVTYTGNGSNRTISHSLGATPKLIMVKGRDTTAAQQWRVYHASNTSAPETDWLALNANTATVDALENWNDTAPTSSVFTVGTDSGVNQDTKTYVAYLFAEVSGFSKFGKYTGNASADGPFAWCGFRPAWIMIKRTDSTGRWYIYDNKRLGYNVDNDNLLADTTEVSETTDYIDILSNGFKLRSAADISINGSSTTHVFIAFAENPFGGSGVSQARAR